MSELVGVLFHPSRWSEAALLSPGERVVLALAVLVVTILIAGAAGVLSSRWTRARAASAAGDGRSIALELLITRTRRGVVALIGFVGAYLAVEVAPLATKLDRAASGVLFVGGAFVGARLVVHLVTLLLTTSVAHASDGERERLQREYVPLGRKVTTLAVSLILVIFVLKHFGQDVTSLIAALGVGSLAIGLAAQQTLGNMISGFTILLDRPFRPGDRIRLATGEVGEVLEIGVRSTRILLGDRNLLIVPNTELANSRVVNYAYPHKVAQAEVRVVVARGEDVEGATKAMLAAAAEDERVLKTPAPSVSVAAFRPQGVELALVAAVAVRADTSAVEESARRRVLKRFAAEKIEIAFTRLETPSAVKN